MTRTASPLVAPAALVAALLVAFPSHAQSPGAGAPELEQRLAAVKQSLAASKQALRKYQWIETTTISMKGEVKSQKQESCYYGADGAIQKTVIAATPPPKKAGGLRGKVAEKKKQEISAEMKQAVALVHSYAPPDPVLLQQCKEQGRLSLEVVRPGQVVRLVCRGYRLPGDALAITLDVAKNQVSALDVTSYIGQPSSPVSFSSAFGNLLDGTVYTASSTLTLPADKVSVQIANTGYRPL